MNWRTHLFIALAVALLAGVIYVNSLRNGFALDDVAIVQENTRVHGLNDLQSILLGSYWPRSGEMYRPVALLSFATDWAISGGDPAWFHAVNVVLHAAVTVLVYLLLARLGASAVGAGLGAVVFAVHPVHVEAVANIVGRAEILAALFFLAGCLLYLRHTAPVVLRILGVAVCYLFALGAKESAVALPAILLLLGVFEQRGKVGRTRSLRQQLRRDLPLYVALGVALAGYLGVRSHVLGWDGASNTASYLWGISTSERLATAVRLWPEFARLLFWPRDLAWDWGPPLVSRATWSHPMVAVGIVLAIAVTGLAVAGWRQNRWLWLAVVWFAATIFLVSQIPFVIGVTLAERLLYLPSVALAFLAPPIVAALEPARPTVRGAAGVGGLVLLLLAGSRTWSRTPIWQSTDTATASLMREHPASYRVLWGAATILYSHGRTDDALRLYRRATELTDGKYYNLNVQYAEVLLADGQPAIADRVVRNSVAQNPSIARGYQLLAASLIDQGNYREALRVVERGRATAKSFPGAEREFAHRAALAYDGLGIADSARVEAVAAALSAAGADAAQWFHLARVHTLLRETDLAEAALAEARARAPTEWKDSLALNTVPAFSSRYIRGWGVLGEVRGPN